jgi:hypothetical protein
MPDDKTKRGKPDRSRVAGGEKYEVAHEAKKLGISQARLKEIIKKVGNSRQKIEGEAKKG